MKWTQRTSASWLTLCVCTLLAAWVAVSAPATADSLNDAKAAGQIGEAPDGYLHLVDSGAPAAVKALVVDINAKRRAKYQGIASSRGVPLAAVSAAAGAKLIERTAKGQFVMGADGSWRRN